MDLDPNKERITASDLLAWAAANSSLVSTEPDPQGEAAPKIDRKNIDPSWLDLILGVEPPRLMKACAEIFSDKQRAPEERENAMLEFEDLVLDLDNANNMVNLKLWQPVLDIVTSSEEIVSLRKMAMRIIVAALQNNSAAQSQLLTKYDGLKMLMSLLEEGLDAEFQSRTVSAISWCIRHSAEVLDSFESTGGFQKFASLLLHGDPSVAIRLLFALTTLLCNDNKDVRSKILLPLSECNIPSTTIEKVRDSTDSDFCEKGHEFLRRFEEVCAETDNKHQCIVDALGAVSKFLSGSTSSRQE